MSGVKRYLITSLFLLNTLINYSQITSSIFTTISSEYISISGSLTDKSPVIQNQLELTLKKNKLNIKSFVWSNYTLEKKIVNEIDVGLLITADIKKKINITLGYINLQFPNQQLFDEPISLLYTSLKYKRTEIKNYSVLSSKLRGGQITSITCTMPFYERKFSNCSLKSALKGELMYQYKLGDNNQGVAYKKLGFEIEFKKGPLSLKAIIDRQEGLGLQKPSRTITSLTIKYNLNKKR